MSHRVSSNVHLDIAIIGGGIAGLWLLNRLRRAGYQVALLESKALGGDQTMGSQGMIHGGIKYTLTGAFSAASETIAHMPQYWRDCLSGKGEVDLSNANLLSDHFYMWSTAHITSKLTTFFASKAARGRVEKITTKDLPEIFQHPLFKGKLYRLVDMVVDVPSVVQALVDNTSGHYFKIDWSQAHWEISPQYHASLMIESPQCQLHIQAKQFIFTAGKGNSALMAQLGINEPAMQIRPLHQVMVKHHYPFPFYGHCLGLEKTPRLTISSHPTADNQQVWYLGGSLAEQGANENADTVITKARHELHELMPWLDFSHAQWASLRIDRAEPRQIGLTRPDNAFAQPADNMHNVIVAWPTKLTLAPNLANQLLALLQQQNILPSNKTDSLQTLQCLPTPTVATPPWDTAFNTLDKG